MSLGEGAEILADRYGISREEQDEFALRSHRKAAAAWDRGASRRRGRRRADAELARDETHPRRHDAGEARAAQAGVPQGRHGDRGQLVADERRRGGAAARRRGRRRRGRAPLARIASRRASSAVEPQLYGIGPVEAANKALRARRHRLGRPEGASSSTRRSPRSRSPAWREWTELDPEIVNVNGGAIALGHPLGSSGDAAADHARPRAAPARRRLGARDDVHRRRPGSRDGDRGMNRLPARRARHAPGSQHARVQVAPACARPTARCVILPQTLSEITGPVYGHERIGPSSTTTSRASTRASRSASGSSSPAACSTATAGRCATRSSRSGRPTPPAATSTRSTSTRRRWTRTSPAPAGR